MAAKKKVSGTVGKKVAGTKRKAVTGTKRKRVSGTRKTAKVGAAKPIGALAKGKQIIAGIAGMEKDYKRTSDKELKKFLAVAINAEHDELDALKRQLKSLKKKK